MTKPIAPPSGSRTEVLLNESEALLAPLVKLLVSQGVGYPQLSNRLKQLFMVAARNELIDEKSKATDAAISMRSGVHRKDVRFWREDSPAERVRKELTLADQIYTKWLSDAAYRDSEGQPKKIPVNGPAPSFDSLATSITKDFHRRTVLDELIRLGLVRETVQINDANGTESDWVIPQADGLVPKADVTEMLRFFSQHAHDHMAASVSNIEAVQKGRTAPFLERSVFGTGLSEQSTEQLGNLARQLWKPAFQQMVDAANQLHSVDKNNVSPLEAQRMRFGIYYYCEPQAQAAPTDGTSS